MDGKRKKIKWLNRRDERKWPAKCQVKTSEDGPRITFELMLNQI